MTEYWMGFATPFIIWGIGYASMIGLTYLFNWLADNGWTVEFKFGRNYEGISDYTLRNNIWFEKQHGPIFTGHWYREDHRYRDGKSFVIPTATRWLGIGKAQGKSIMIFKQRDLDND